MTIKDYIFSQLAFAPNNTNSIDAAMLDQALDGTGLYDVSFKLPCVKAAIAVMQQLLTTADTVNTVDGQNAFSIKYDRPSVLARINLLKGENGLTDESRPYIKGPRVW